MVEYYQGIKNKLEKLQEIVGDEFESVAYVGDDLPDLPCMERVKASGGIVLAPADAIPEIKAIADYVSGYKAGEGAVRDCINYLNLNKKRECEIRVKQVIDWVLNGANDRIPLPFDFQYTIQEYETKQEQECVIETHRNHIDVQYIIEGHEEFILYSTSCLSSEGHYNSERDVELWRGGVQSSKSVLLPGSLIVVYNGIPHKGAIIHKKVEKVKKLVCKILV